MTQLIFHQIWPHHQQVIHFDNSFTLTQQVIHHRRLQYQIFVSMIRRRHLPNPMSLNIIHHQLHVIVGLKMIEQNQQMKSSLVLTLNDPEMHIYMVMAKVFYTSYAIMHNPLTSAYAIMHNPLIAY